ncbi:class I SAM-dependent rRNA methyltransferase [Fluoribacter dumoffii]|uniref:Ribosomal RNA large subunit methyltransferase I n=1 Tax=Fluoribacter dumoffii TaxID=463 RepID=A0A377GB25_9GAMM|nr:class I SAM-dependent rRNA methyltransferase [Fluoribacter dumoffii]KTC88812.1 SAM-dependent methyltransferase [Fluoribacter dumoffii NY 23]MCW8385892.1 class I SAM-dependent rRNA methyltransferase [Fluoribacter dumoffii]MCW8418946.1 class I SAM-dependent rRNA methyltransferase [Fluoribacter dumoffii]MCW8453210.1 class I SAM-dependent rRNA methyltransferase [Fluoribacter dumoffii]MCW8459569.1 class I SAM-dependent rRNA methyltransferase [Fluoribacter dumoffii]
MKAKVILLKAKQNTVLRGHPWIFPKAIAKTHGKLITGHLIDIYSAEEELIGVGIYNEHSLYRVRVLALSNESLDTSNLHTLITHRLNQAKQVRDCLSLPNEETTAYRLFNSEADGLSGLTIDRFNQNCVVASSAYWVELNREVIINALKNLFPADQIIWMPQSKPLSQDGWKQISVQEQHYNTKVLEAGVIYEVEFAQAQKTGLFLDQRENHQRIAQLSKGKKILDLYCYSGGFALHAARAGATKITAVDSSAQAIAQAKNNAALNGVTQIEFIEADARDYLTKAGDYDLVVLDPPKLVPSKQHVERAKNYYRFLHREVFKNMKAGSLLMTCNCSSALSSSEFCSLVSAQAGAVGKQARILGVYGPASCHPTLTSFPEGNYLTAILLAVV